LDITFVANDEIPDISGINTPPDLLLYGVYHIVKVKECFSVCNIVDYHGYVNVESLVSYFLALPEKEVVMAEAFRLFYQLAG
jgi:hypothetical protein